MIFVEELLESDQLYDLSVAIEKNTLEIESIYETSISEVIFSGNKYYKAKAHFQLDPTETKVECLCVQCTCVSDPSVQIRKEILDMTHINSVLKLITARDTLPHDLLLQTLVNWRKILQYGLFPFLQVRKAFLLN